MYSIDTVPGTIWVRDYDAATGATGPRREFLHIEGGYPDGMCVDERGHLWVAIWDGFEVRSFAPDGTASDTVTLPCPHVSSVAFAGPRLDTLVITTSSRDLDEAGIERYPDAGRLFVADVGVAGTSCAAWSGSWAGRADRGM
jgi:sugar lactone lactonase YvrE